MTKKIAIENSREMVEKLKEIRIEDYTYDLPDERIAKFPLENREASKLLIYDEGRIDERHFYEVPEMLDAGKMLVFNNTKVIYARILFQKVTGAVIEVFCLESYRPLGLRAELCRLREVRVEMYGRKSEEMERGNDFLSLPV